MKHLRIDYNGMTLYDGEVNEVTWSDSDSGIRVEGRVRGQGAPTSGGGGLAGFLETLSSASRNKTQEMVDEKRADLRREKEDSASEVSEVPTPVAADAEVAVAP